MHVICALFTDGVIFENVSDMEPINIEKVSNTKRNKTCTFCGKSFGFCCLCSRTSCKNRLHITCAQRANCLKEDINKSNSRIKFRAYCNEHKPTKSTRRISSQFVRGRLMEKHGQKEQQECSKNLNLDWIINGSEKSESVAGGKAKKRNHVESETEKNEVKKNKHKSHETETSSDKQSEENQVHRHEIEPEVGKGIAVEADSVKLWWDTRDLRLQDQDFFVGELNQSEATEFNKENVINLEHACFKDEKITKVSKNPIQIFFTIQIMELADIQLFHLYDTFFKNIVHTLHYVSVDHGYRDRYFDLSLYIHFNGNHCKAT